MIIATRVLTLRDATGDRNVLIRMHAPEPDDRCWRCSYEIDWPDGKIQRESYGEDAVQALELALQIVGAHLYASEHHASGRLMWLEPGQGYGFPVTKNLRDLLVGQDRQLYGDSP
jgi:hypothetical protein